MLHCTLLAVHYEVHTILCILYVHIHVALHIMCCVQPSQSTQSQSQTFHTTLTTVQMANRLQTKCTCAKSSVQFQSGARAFFYYLNSFDLEDRRLLWTEQLHRDPVDMLRSTERTRAECARLQAG